MTQNTVELITADISSEQYDMVIIKSNANAFAILTLDICMFMHKSKVDITANKLICSVAVNELNVGFDFDISITLLIKYADASEIITSVKQRKTICVSTVVDSKVKIVLHERAIALYHTELYVKLRVENASSVNNFKKTMIAIALM